MSFAGDQALKNESIFSVAPAFSWTKWPAAAPALWREAESEIK